MNILKSLVVLLLSGMIYSQSMLGPHEDGIKSYMIIGYKIVPSLDDGYGCWSELDIMWHQSIPKSTVVVSQEKLDDSNSQAIGGKLLDSKS